MSPLSVHGHKTATVFLQLLDRVSFFQNNPKDLDPSYKMDLKNNRKNLDPSYKMDLDLSDCFGKVKFV